MYNELHKLYEFKIKKHIIKIKIYEQV